MKIKQTIVVLKGDKLAKDSTENEIGLEEKNQKNQIKNTKVFCNLEKS